MTTSPPPRPRRRVVGRPARDREGAAYDREVLRLQEDGYMIVRTLRGKRWYWRGDRPLEIGEYVMLPNQQPEQVRGYGPQAGADQEALGDVIGLFRARD